MIEEESFDDIIDNKEFFADFDLDDISALEEGESLPPKFENPKLWPKQIQNLL